MTSIVSTITSFCGKRKIGEISIDNTEILEENKIKLWKAAVNPNNSKRNKFITVHGNINETILANEYCKNRYKNNDNTDLSYTVPEGIIIVDLAQDNTVVFSNPMQDMEMAVFKSIPNWITTPIFGEEEQLKNPNFNDDKKIQTNVQIITDIKNKRYWNDLFNKKIEEIVKKCNNNSSTTSTAVIKAKNRNEYNTICKVIDDSLVKGNKTTLEDYRMTAADIGNLDNINEAYKTSIKLVKTIDDYILKEEFGLTEENGKYNLYKFDRSHENFDLQGPNMIMQCSHIYFLWG